MGFWRSYLSTWKYPTIQYSFPDEESFKVDIINETGYWFWTGQKVTQIFEINGTNVHQSEYLKRIENLKMPKGLSNLMLETITTLDRNILVNCIFSILCYFA